METNTSIIINYLKKSKPHNMKFSSYFTIPNLGFSHVLMIAFISLINISKGEDTFDQTSNIMGSTLQLA